jgi:UDP-N-acetylglucosamine--dolichyl-phosphate N-acetylglucosaminephosphotransferase
MITPFVCAAISFLIVWFMTPWLVRYLRRIGLVVKDMNKEGTPLVPLSGGLTVMAGVFAGLMVFIFFRTFFPSTTGLVLDNGALLHFFAGITTILLISFVGFIDDLVINTSRDRSSGLKQWQKPLLTLSAAIPLMVLDSGVTVMGFPFLGELDLGLLYPLFFIPIGVIGAANMVNMLGGFNGMEAGMGIVYTGMLGLYAYTHQSYVGALIALVTFTALIGFYFYNRYPAKILPGDSLTYLLGAVLACIAILGNMEKAALIVSIPFFIEFFLKARSKFKAQSYGYYKDGKIHSKYKNVYSIPHIFTRTGKYTEKQITWFMILIELGFSSLIWLL